jgi:hypothetical protein
MTKSKTIKETRKSNFSVTWVYDDYEDTRYLVPVSVADIFITGGIKLD